MNYERKKAHCEVAQQPAGRNQAIEWCRFVSSVFVVFIHCLFPGKFGEIMDCLARFAVPFFFMVSGYFAYRSDEKVIKKRAISIFKLNVSATLLYFLWGSYVERYVEHRGRMAWLMEHLSFESLSQWIFNCINPFEGHLWYLNAIFVCYIMLYVYVRWWNGVYNYHSLYLVSVMLYVLHTIMGPVATAVDFRVPFMIYRNALLFGIPMFSLGIFIREYQNKILVTYNLSREKLVLIIVIGAILSVLQWQGTGEIEMPIGTLFETIALMLLVTSAPSKNSDNRVFSFIASKLGEISVYVYITHMIWVKIYYLYIADYMVIFGKILRKYLDPIMVVMISVCTGIIWLTVKNVVRKYIFREKCTAAT